MNCLMAMKNFLRMICKLRQLSTKYKQITSIKSESGLPSPPGMKSQFRYTSKMPGAPMPVPQLLFVLGSLLTLLITACSPEKEATPPFYPKVLDNRLSLELILENPDIVTPIGLTIDSEDNLYVLESHTHTPPSDYAGPKYDRIKKGVDEDKDGKPDSWIIFADSIEDGMNLACGPDDIIYLVEKDSVFSFQDTDGDGVSDERKVLLQMRASSGVYDHAALLGVTYGPDGWLYISRGNTGGLAWELEGTDGSVVEGYGDGGNVMRCRPDGSQLEEIATGFWNPFDIKFSQKSRLLLVDNDPDSRGPNRLIEIVPGGDYGYQSLYGGSGIHPFLAWNGELPGTLPYAAGIGEAPSGLIDASYSSFPAEYAGNILATIWEENSIVNVPLQPNGSTVQGEAKVLVQGDSTFHPVALAANSKGDIYITDWVVRQYPAHGKGRIWRLTSGEETPLQVQTVAYEDQQAPHNEFFALNENTKDFDQLLQVLQTEDAFVQTVARKKLQDAAYLEKVLALTESEDADLRLQALLILMKTKTTLSKATLQQLLADENEEVRRMTLIYIAKHSREDLYDEVTQSLYEEKITPALFETYLATIRHLQPDFIRDFQTKAEKSSKQLKRELPPSYIISIIKNGSLSPEIRAAALPYLENPDENAAELTALLNTSPASMQEGLLQVFKKINDKNAAEAILQIALNPKKENTTRAQALVSLSHQSARYCDEVATILEEENEILLETAVRYLCRCGNKEAVSQNMEKEEALAIWQLCNGQPAANRPQTDEQWRTIANGEGNAEKGRFVFQSMKAQCQNCHTVDGWGGHFGPDLSNIGSSKTREQLITAILEPSAEISPEWQGWFVTTREGQTHYGRQIDVGYNNVEIMLPSGEFVTYDEPKNYGMAPTSLMPEGLEMQLTEAEFNDLITYLMSLR